MREVEAPAVSYGGRNGQLWRGACVDGGGGEHVRVLCCCWRGGRKWEGAGKADARVAGVGERGGARGPPDGQVPPLPAHVKVLCLVLVISDNA
jgi:hypothetical protein